MSVMTAPGQDDAPAFMWGRRHYKYAGKHLGTGNRCGHDPQNLSAERLALPEVKNGFRVKILQRLIDRAQAYFNDPASVPLLAYLSGKKNRDGSPRQNRSEGREAQSLILSAIYASMDLKSLRVGTYTPRGEFKNLSFLDLALRCGLTRQVKNEDTGVVETVPSSRFWRGVAWLKKAGAMTVFEQYEETPDGPRGRPAIKHMSAKFLRDLGGFTKAQFKTATKKASHKVAEYLAGSTAAGIQTVQEREQLQNEIRSERVHKELFPKPAIKNRMPPEVPRDNSAGSQVDDYTAYTQAIYARIERDTGTKPRGKQGMELFARYGGLSRDAWLRERHNL
jgi:hypothetical protein